MENLEQQTQIINLGKIIVQQLSIDNSTDTLSRWMAHYIAEKITLAETMLVGEEKENAEKECFETILKLWEHRWLLPAGKRPLEDFESIYKVLERINPEKEDLFFYKFYNQDTSENNDENLEPREMSECVDTVLKIDKAARIWLNYILGQAALKLKNENTDIVLKNAVKLSDNNDIQIIQLIFDNNPTLDPDKFQEDSFKKKHKLETLKKRVYELEKYSAINKLILDSYKKELLNVDIL